MTNQRADLAAAIAEFKRAFWAEITPILERILPPINRFAKRIGL